VTVDTGSAKAMTSDSFVKNIHFLLVSQL